MTTATHSPPAIVIARSKSEVDANLTNFFLSIGKPVSEIGAISTNTWFITDPDGKVVYTARPRAIGITLSAGHYTVSVHIWRRNKALRPADGSVESYSAKLTVGKARDAAKPTVVTSVVTAPNVRRNTTRALLARTITEFEADVLLYEGIVIKLYPVTKYPVATSRQFTAMEMVEAIHAKYSRIFLTSLTGKRSVVKQLIARLAEVVDATKIEIKILDKAGNVVDASATLAKLR